MSMLIVNLSGINHKHYM